MAKIYSPPEGFEAPELDIKGDVQDYFKACDDYVKRLQESVRASYGSVCPEAGEIIAFPVADGKARYVVARLKPVELIHIDTGDAYHFEYVHRLTAKDVREEIRKVKALDALFSRRGS